MSMKTLEAAILLEAKAVTGKKSLRLKDIVEWSTSDENVVIEGDETRYFLPDLRVYIAVTTGSRHLADTDTNSL